MELVSRAASRERIWRSPSSGHPRCGSLRERSYGESQLIMISQGVGEGDTTDKAVRPESYVPSCRRKADNTDEARVQNMRRLPTEYPLDSGATFREIRGGNVFIEENVSWKRQHKLDKQRRGLNTSRVVVASRNNVKSCRRNCANKRQDTWIYG